VTTIAVKIAIIAVLAMPLSFGTAFAGDGGEPSNTEPLSSQTMQRSMRATAKPFGPWPYVTTID